jgi:hypothetical protein
MTNEKIIEESKFKVYLHNNNPKTWIVMNKSLSYGNGFSIHSGEFNKMGTAYNFCNWLNNLSKETETRMKNEFDKMLMGQNTTFLNSLINRRIANEKELMKKEFAEKIENILIEVEKYISIKGEKNFCINRLKELKKSINSPLEKNIISDEDVLFATSPEDTSNSKVKCDNCNFEFYINGDICFCPNCFKKFEVKK